MNRCDAGSRLLVHVTPMGDLSHGDDARMLIDVVHYVPIALTNPVSRNACQFDGIVRNGSTASDRTFLMTRFKIRLRDPLELLFGAPFESDVIAFRHA